MTSPPDESSLPVLWGRRLGRASRWVVIGALLYGVAGSIIYTVMFKKAPVGRLGAASCRSALGELDAALRQHSATVIEQHRPGTPAERLAFFAGWDAKLSDVRGTCPSDTAVLEAASKLERLRYAHESLLDRFERDLVPLRDSVASSIARD